MLARLEAKQIAQRRGHIERDGYCIARLALDARNRQRVELAHDVVFSAP